MIRHIAGPKLPYLDIECPSCRDQIKIDPNNYEDFVEAIAAYLNKVQDMIDDELAAEDN